jgi:two-component system, OmpR family, response regulator
MLVHRAGIFIAESVVQVLIVEDDTDIATYLASGLAKLGHGCDIAGSGERALEALAETRFDAIVLDRLLPGMDGVEVLRRKPWDVPVLVLSALGTTLDRVEGLDAGADDYLVKPFDIVEVAARLNAIVRRSDPERANVLRVGAIEISLASGRASRGGRPIHLNKKEFGLLAEFLRNADRVMTRRMLIEAVWGYSFDPSTNLVESNLSRLRTKLVAAQGSDPIETLRGVGYVLREALA